MIDGFETVIANLWNALGLGLSTPRLRPDGTAALTVDDREVVLAGTHDGAQILVSSKAGQLSANPATMDDQVVRLLKSNLPGLLSSRACCRLVDQNAETPAVMIQATAPCGLGGMDRLVEMIGDVTQMAARYSRELNDGPAPRRIPEELTLEDVMVFRP
jgi:hypothetical protein